MTVAASASRAQTARPSFYLWVSVGFVIVAFAGFVPTYWLPLAQGTFHASALVHLHGGVFFAWTFFVVYQTWLVSAGRIVNHRDVGLVGISLASVMTILGMTTAIVSATRVSAAGFGMEAKAFLIVPFFALLFFATTIGFAIGNVRRIDWHKRLMLVATACILEAPIARWVFVLLAPPNATLAPPPVIVALMPALVGDLFIVAGIVYDWRLRGSPHRAYLIGGGALLAMQFARDPLSRTGAWDVVANWLVSIVT